MVKLMTMLNIKGRLDIMSTSTINNRRGKGDGLIGERSDGRFEYRYVAGRKPNGTIIYKSFYGKSEKELKRKIKEYNEDRTKYTVKVEATSFHDYAEFWMRTVKYPILKPVSYDRLEQTYNAVCNYIGWIQLGSVSTEDIQAMINDLSTTKAYSTVVKTKKTEILPEDITKKMYVFNNTLRQSNN